jgi:hypothetical protein
MTWIRKLLPFLSLTIAAALIYDGAIFFSRWNSRRQAERERTDREAADRRKAVDSLGEGGLKILSFYVAPATIRPGDSTTLCYGVTGAKTVRLEPAVEEVWPALTRCVKASPKKDTKYTFAADDGVGHTTTETVSVRIR